MSHPCFSFLIVLFTMFSFFFMLLIPFTFSIFSIFHFSAVVRFRVAAFVYLLISRLARLVGTGLDAKHHPSDAAEEASLPRVPHSRTDHASCEMITQKRKRLDDFQNTLGSLRRRTPVAGVEWMLLARLRLCKRPQRVFSCSAATLQVWLQDLDSFTGGVCFLA